MLWQMGVSSATLSHGENGLLRDSDEGRGAGEDEDEGAEGNVNGEDQRAEVGGQAGEQERNQAHQPLFGKKK